MKRVVKFWVSSLKLLRTLFIMYFIMVILLVLLILVFGGNYEEVPLKPEKQRIEGICDREGCQKPAIVRYEMRRIGGGLGPVSVYNPENVIPGQYCREHDAEMKSRRSSSIFPHFINFYLPFIPYLILGCLVTVIGSIMIKEYLQHLYKKYDL